MILFLFMYIQILNKQLKKVRSLRYTVTQAEVNSRMRRYGIRHLKAEVLYSNYSRTLLYLMYKEDILLDYLNDVI